MEGEEVQCPSCWEFFLVGSPPPEERPCEVDYDCEVCCRPLLILYPSEGGALARSLDD